MIKTCRVPAVYLLVLVVLVLTAISCSQRRPQIVEQLANAYGFDSFGQIEGLRYTFNADFGVAKVSRSWVWEPKTGRVSFNGKDKAGNPLKVTYLRSQISSQPAVVKDVVDPAFTNDNYWLIFPFHVYWDTSATVDDMGMQKLPIGNGTAEHVVVKYPAGGYTPGDTWELFLGSDKRVQEFVFHHGGSVKPSLVIASWEDYRKAGPLLVAMNHPGTADGKPVRIFFSDVAAKLTGSDNWVNAQ